MEQDALESVTVTTRVNEDAEANARFPRRRTDTTDVAIAEQVTLNPPTLHESRTPRNLHPVSTTMKNALETVNPTPCVLGRKSYTWFLKPYTIYPADPHPSDPKP